MTRIFISHSHSDEAITFKLVNFLLATLRIEEEEILCTSNPDQGLSYNSNSITDQLKNQLKNSEAIIILITADSLHSAWIPFEAGSFWTTDKPIIPILGTDLTQNDLPGPLRSFLSIAITIEKTGDTEELELKSENGVDYTKLRNLLQQHQWQEADKETAKVMLQAASRESEGYLTVENLDNFPCEDLGIIKQLWSHYSEGKFGFSAQKEIYESVEGIRKYNRKVWNSFGDRVGWRKGVNWLDYDQLIFNITAPKAHLPGVHLLGSPSRRAVMPSGEAEIFYSLMQKLVTCKFQCP